MTAHVCPDCGGRVTRQALRCAPCAKEYRRTVVATRRFWARVDRTAGPSACWPWTGAASRKLPYGRTWWDGRGAYAHRVAYALANGPMQAGTFVLHGCDNPICCNPSHLRLGDHAENMRDMRSRGRASRQGGGARGAANGAPRALTARQVNEIREAIAAGQRSIDVALRYRVSKSTVAGIKLGLTYRWVPLAAIPWCEQWQMDGNR